MAVAQDQLVEVVTKAVEFRQTLVTLLLGAAGFALAKSWPDRASRPDRGALLRLLPSMGFGVASLLMMLYEQRGLVQAVAGGSFTAFSVHWINWGEPVIDVSMVCSVFLLLFGVRK